MNIKGIIIVIIGLLWLWAIYTGYITMVKRAIQSTPEIESTSSTRVREQREKAKILREKQKRLMEDRKTRLRDLKRL